MQLERCKETAGGDNGSDKELNQQNSVETEEQNKTDPEDENLEHVR